jgi:hypothetical protein
LADYNTHVCVMFADRPLCMVWFRWQFWGLEVLGAPSPVSWVDFWAIRACRWHTSICGSTVRPKATSPPECFPCELHLPITWIYMKIPARFYCFHGWLMPPAPLLLVYWAQRLVQLKSRGKTSAQHQQSRSSCANVRLSVKTEYRLICSVYWPHGTDLQMVHTSLDLRHSKAAELH